MQFQACSYCDHPNAVGMNYCNDCGGALHLKPCRSCGAVVRNETPQCPACHSEFPVKPIIDVDIPWATRGNGWRASSSASPPTLPSPPSTIANDPRALVASLRFQPEMVYATTRSTEVTGVSDDFMLLHREPLAVKFAGGGNPGAAVGTPVKAKLAGQAAAGRTPL